MLRTTERLQPGCHWLELQCCAIELNSNRVKINSQFSRGELIEVIHIHERDMNMQIIKNAILMNGLFSTRPHLFDHRCFFYIICFALVLIHFRDLDSFNLIFSLYFKFFQILIDNFLNSSLNFGLIYFQRVQRRCLGISFAQMCWVVDRKSQRVQKKESKNLRNPFQLDQ